MIIPELVRVGSVFYEVKTQETPIVINGVQCLGYCNYFNHTIMLDLSMSDEQTMEQTFYHELVHAMLYERKINLEAMGLSNAQMEEVVEAMGIALHQVLLDNPDLTLTAEEFDAKYPPEEEAEIVDVEKERQVAPKTTEVKQIDTKTTEE